MIDILNWIETNKGASPVLAACVSAFVSAIVTLVALFIGDRMNQRRHDKEDNRKRELALEDEQQRQQEAVNKSLSKVLEASYGITTYSAYDDEHKEELPKFNDTRYKDIIRPALYENYNWLPEEMKLQIFRIDQVVFHSRFDSYDFPHEHDQDMDKKFWALTLMIRKHFGLPQPEF